MIARNLTAHCVVVAGLTNASMELSKVITTGEHCYGVASIYGVQARTLDCSFDLQWTVLRGAPVVIGEKCRKFLGVALDGSVFFGDG